MKPDAKDLLKNKTAMKRVHNERVFQNVVTRRTNMTKAGNRRNPGFMTLEKKKPVAANNKNKSPVKKSTVNQKNNKNMFTPSMRVYKTQLAIPFAQTGLHDPSSPGYHNNLVSNMKNLAARRTNILPMHNKAWFVEQLKRNVWALRNDQPMVRPTQVMTLPRCGATKTQKMLKNHLGKKVTKPKALSSKKLLEQLKSVKPIR